MPDTTSQTRLSRDVDEIRAGLFRRIEAVQDEYAAKGYLPSRLNLNKGVARGFIELFGWGLWQLYNFLSVVHRQAIPLQATGQWLDMHAAQVDENRKPATKAKGMVTFSRGDYSGNIRIPPGRIVRTKPDGTGAVYRYVTDELGVLPQGSDTVDVPATAEEYGQSSNAAQGQICELVTPVEGIRSVTNSASWLTSEGADEENDASLRRRYVLAWKSRAGITRAAYEAAALSVPGAVDVYVADQHPRGEGTVDVIVQGAAGMPTQKLLDDVRAALDSHIVINHDLLVKAPIPVIVPVCGVLELLTGDAETSVAQAEAWIKAMFSYGDNPQIPRFSIGKDVIRDRLASGIVAISGVKRIRWASPSTDIPIPPDSLAVLGDLEITSEWVEQP